MPELPFPDQAPPWLRTVIVVAGILASTFVLNVLLRRPILGPIQVPGVEAYGSSSVTLRASAARTLDRSW